MSNTVLLILRVVIFTILILVIGLLLIIIINSPGKLKKYPDENRNIMLKSISEKTYLEFNDWKFGLFIEGKSIDNPVLLYLHGGMPDFFLTQKFPTGLDKIFTVVWWDQRGAGLSYDKRIDNDSITTDLLVEDTKEITNYLRRRFSQDKIYLMAHSGGTYIGIKSIEKYPELYKAYIGVSQIANQKLSEKKAYDYIIEEYKKAGRRKNLIKELEKNQFTLDKPVPKEYIKVRDYAMHDLGIGTMKKMKGVMSGIFIPSLLFRKYTLSEKIKLWKGKASTGIGIVWKESINHDLSQEIVNFKIPVYFMHGVYDYTCSYELAEEYYKRIQAPKKDFFSFYDSAHSPMFEEPEKFINIIVNNVL